MARERRKKDPIICDCLNVSEKEILEAIHRHKITTLLDLIRYTRAGEGCTACHPALRAILEDQSPFNCSDK